MTEPMEDTTPPPEAVDAPPLEGTPAVTKNKTMTAITLRGEAVRTPSFDGWGCSLCWWANEYVDSKSATTLADYFFSTNTTNQLPGLGMNIVRYNVGAGTSFQGSTAIIDPNTIENISPNNRVYNPQDSFRYISGYWLNWYNTDPDNTVSWDWTRDPRQRAMLQLARNRGVNLIELFSNSPPWWMCYNHSASGARPFLPTLSGDNLQGWNYHQFATYLAVVVQYFRDNQGIPVNYIEPFNEPYSLPWVLGGWWTYPGYQEGCNFAPDTQAAVLNYLNQEISSRHQPVGLTASDENSMDLAVDTLSSWCSPSDPSSLLAKINVHGYDGQCPYRGSARGELRALVNRLAGQPKKLWMSEYGDDDPSGCTMATSIMMDMSQLQPDAWIYWQPIDWMGWGFFSMAAPDNYGLVQRKFYVFAQFSRHIKHGDSILDSNSPWTINAHNPAEKRLSIVYLNTTTAPGNVTFNISKIVDNIRLAQLRAYQTTMQPGVNGAADHLYQELNNTGSNLLSFSSQTGEVTVSTEGKSVTSIDIIYQ
jgi:galactan endo-1,6-beta-galactosidase